MKINELKEKIEGKAFVLYKKPGGQTLHLLTLHPNRLQQTEHLETEGYYIAPFVRNGRFPFWFFPGRYVDRFVFEPEKTGETTPGNRIFFSDVSAEKHKDKVSRAIDFIRNNEIKKIVVSSPADARIEQFFPLETFLNIARNYRNSYVFYWHIPGFMSMMGATPEVLLQYAKNEGTIYSLAGTKFRSENREWQAKEYDEQNFVTDFIKQKLIAWQYPFHIDGPYDFTQGDLIHLRTDFLFFFEPVPKNLWKILRSLHPTPAVSGLPQKQAVAYILENEGYDRGYYTGFLGEMRLDEGEFFVNLRSFSFDENRMRLYAGGGITQESKPEAEWNEVKRKWNIMRKFLNNEA